MSNRSATRAPGSFSLVIMNFVDGFILSRISFNLMWNFRFSRKTPAYIGDGENPGEPKFSRHDAPYFFFPPQPPHRHTRIFIKDNFQFIETFSLKNSTTVVFRSRRSVDAYTCKLTRGRVDSNSHPKQRPVRFLFTDRFVLREHGFHSRNEQHEILAKGYQ